ncbi:MAG: PilZ domain-containing protein, partial [Alphaproteobacteria bacterium]
MLEDRKEYPCQTKDISPGSVSLITPITARAGERAVAYIDHIGRIEGRVARVYNGGFAMSISATARKRDKLAAKLTWLANRHELSLPEDRRHDRVTSTVDEVTVGLPDGREIRSRVLDISLSGAALSTPIQPPLGSPLIVGKLRATVARHFDDGIAIE